MIIHQDIYDGSLIHSRFAYRYFKDGVLPQGNIVSFVAPMKVEVDFMIDLEDVLKNDFIYSEKAINFCYELPIVDLFGGVAFQRLFNTYIGDILQGMIKKPVQLEGDDIYVVDEFTQGGIVQQRGKSSVSIVCEKNGAILGHTAINITAGEEAPSFAYSTGMSNEQATEFMNKVNAVFNATTKDIFIATTKII